MKSRVVQHTQVCRMVTTTYSNIIYNMSICFHYGVQLLRYTRLRRFCTALLVCLKGTPCVATLATAARYLNLIDVKPIWFIFMNDFDQFIAAWYSGYKQMSAASHCKCTSSSSQQLSWVLIECDFPFSCRCHLNSPTQSAKRAHDSVNLDAKILITNNFYFLLISLVISLLNLGLSQTLQRLVKQLYTYWPQIQIKFQQGKQQVKHKQKYNKFKILFLICNVVQVIV